MVLDPGDPAPDISAPTQDDTVLAPDFASPTVVAGARPNSNSSPASERCTRRLA